MANKRVAVIADLHCGHLVGLTPPYKQQAFFGKDSTAKSDKWATLQRVLWQNYTEALNRIKPIDVLIVNGDLIDGKGKRSGGTELITNNRDIQAEMTAHCIVEAECRTIRMTYGTPYHVGSSEDQENKVVDKLKDFELFPEFVSKEPDIKIGSHEWLDINGVIFDVKHFTSASSIPHGKGTPLGKEWLWNALWAEQQMQPRADIYIRSHVHYAYHCGEPNSWYALTTPALQGMGSKFGSRICKGIVHFGILSFDITTSGAWQPHWDIITIAEQATTAERL